MWTDLLILLPAGAVFLFLLLRVLTRRSRLTDADLLPRKPIVLDGSNIMYWGGDPSAKTLNHVIGHITQKDYSPIVIFDASAGYRLSDRFMTEQDFARLTFLPERQILVVNKGVVADEVILDFATTHDLRIVTNDRYRDWAKTFPIVRKKGRLLKGSFKQGTVVLNGL